MQLHKIRNAFSSKTLAAMRVYLKVKNEQFKNTKWTHYILRSSLVFVIKKHYMQRTSIFLSKAMHLLHCAYILRWEMHNLKESLVQDSTFLVTDLVNFWYNDPKTSLVSSYQKWLQTSNIWVSCAHFVYLFSK